jgi:hypothetical protein
MKIFIILLSLFSCSLFSGCHKSEISNTDSTKSHNTNITDSSESNFEIKIVSDKKEYYQLEPVWITIQVKNIGANIDSFRYFANNEFLHGMTVEDKNNNQLQCKYPLIEYASERLIRLNSNEQKSIVVGLNSGFGENELLYQYKPKYYFSPGKYLVKLKYYDGFHNKMMLPNNIEFSVKPPKKDALKIFNRIIEINKTYNVKPPNWNDFIKDIKKLYDNNQHNIYSEVLLFNCAQNCIYENYNNEKFINESKVFFDKYPDSYFNETMIESFVVSCAKGLKKQKQDVIDILNEIIAKHPNTKLHEAVLNLLNYDEFMNHLFKREKEKKKE